MLRSLSLRFERCLVLGPFSRFRMELTKSSDVCAVAAVEATDRDTDNAIYPRQTSLGGPGPLGDRPSIWMTAVKRSLRMGAVVDG